MKIALLARNHRLYSHKRLQQAAQDRGHELDMIDTLSCYLSLASGNSQVFVNGEPLNEYDAVIPRIGASATVYGRAVLRQFQTRGVWALNRSEGIGCAADKLQTMQVLARAGVKLPLTTFAHDPKHARQVLQAAGGAPVIIKLLEGSLGMGVILAETERTAISIIKAFTGARVNILIQRYVKESGGSDVRALVIGNRVVASMMRAPAKGEFRSNLHRGGHAQQVELSPAEAEMSVQAAKAVGLNVCGVDLLRSNDGPLVLEVNSSPGLEGIETHTGIDIAGAIIEFVETNFNSQANG